MDLIIRHQRSNLDRFKVTVHRDYANKSCPFTFQYG